MSVARSIVIAAVFGLGFAGANAAYARDAVFTARLQQPVSEPTRVIAQDTIWDCEGDTCRARPDHGANVRSCRQLARELDGRITEYGAESDRLSADELSRCNRDGESSQQARN